MEQVQLTVPDGIFKGKLHAAIWQLQNKSDFDKQLIDDLLLILKMDLRQISEEMLRENYKPETVERFTKIDIIPITNNKELLARVLDIQIVLNRTLIGKHLKNVAGYYYDIFSIKEDFEYLVRYLAVIKQAKAIFSGQLTDIFDRLKPILVSKPSPYWLSRICFELTIVFGKEESQNLLKNLLEKRKAEYLSKREYQSAIWCVDGLQGIGVFNEQERHVQAALVLEQEADQIVAERQPNTYYPTLSNKLSAALNLVFDVQEGQEVKKRLIAKLEAARLDDIKMVAVGGAKISPEIDYDKLLETVNQMNINSFQDGWRTLLGIPVLTESLFNPSGAKPEPTFFDQFFDTYIRLSTKGKPIGTTKGDAAKMNEARLNAREILIILLKMIKNKMDIFGIPPEEFMLQNLVDIKSSFIPNSRLRIYARGLAAGFENDFLLSAHLLVPQLENSFRHVAELKKYR
ncbi:hypothetical protein ACRQ5D_31385 [Mucilaginibacter sp. P25]|uniref:hypothetical protein n=1 Tax=Mucilaginibacter sp. P25 TaxID=3423945 RepID=UPI003D7B0B63